MHLCSLGASEHTVHWDHEDQMTAFSLEYGSYRPCSNCLVYVFTCVYRLERKREEGERGKV